MITRTLTKIVDDKLFHCTKPISIVISSEIL